MRLVLVIALIACGAKQPTGETAGSGSAAPPIQDTRTPLEQRRDAAVKKLAPKLTACALEDAKAELAAGHITKQKFDETTTPEILAKNTQKYVDEMSAERGITSRQVRVLEVCSKEEPECGPLNACLANFKQAK